MSLNIAGYTQIISEMGDGGFYCKQLAKILLFFKQNFKIHSFKIEWGRDNVLGHCVSLAECRRLLSNKAKEKVFFIILEYQIQQWW